MDYVFPWVEGTTPRKVASESTISTRSHIVNVALAKGREAEQALPKLSSIINFERGETLRIVQGE